MSRPPVEHPAAQHHADGRRLSASYVYFYLANGAVIMPMFDDRMDEPAYKAITAAFPDCRVIQLDAGDLVFGVHCITQQQPAATPFEGGAASVGQGPAGRLLIFPHPRPTAG